MCVINKTKNNYLKSVIYFYARPTNFYHLIYIDKNVLLFSFCRNSLRTKRILMQETKESSLFQDKKKNEV